MKGAITERAMRVRPYRDGDEGQVLALLEAALGGGPSGVRSPELFRWKHLDNPFGRSFMLVGESAGRLIGLRAFLRWRFRAGDTTVSAVRAVDTATHPDFQGQGVFSRLTREGLDGLRGEAELVFNTPNEKSLPGYLKMGWRLVGTVPVFLRVRHPVRFVRRLTTPGAGRRPSRPAPEVAAASAERVLSRTGAIDSLLGRVGEASGRLQTPLSPAYLRWRYADPPLLDYRAIVEERDGRAIGIALFRVRPRGGLWESTVADLLVGQGDTHTARRLLRAVVRAADVDHVVCSFPARSTAIRAARACGFLRAHRGVRLTVNALSDSIDPDPADIRSWELSLGDLEVF